ncbi:fungal-specific transcription factor domain-containing protein [Annulohypoxylon maeteangense]|uniref:fungal-specific transcription factor domain-containing protein n=1 Tax=Annulohypoxylon maeteangense TaxID=1927788 RepID=UPI00200802B1|nr:fungal-specific transcription factor domain-containing protein [Annulohypoxylon maeteangense]KAI0885864.1 fungal-specific transcription factor domain-containing protein [Annulohypoxylon maeteangense]
MNSALRQQPGLACENCRKKKSRCDRARPECGSCTATGAVCVFTNKRPQRGPRKGQLQALRARIATLERCLDDQNEYVDLDHGVFFGPLTPLEGSTASSTTTSPETTRKPSIIQSSDVEYDHSSHDLFPNLHGNLELSATESTRSNRRLDDLDHGIFPDLLLPIGDEVTLVATNQPSDEESPDGSETTFISGSTIVNTAAQPTKQSWSNPSIPETAPYSKGTDSVDEIGDLVQADLDQLYFDRIHPVNPLVRRARYVSWTRKPEKEEVQIALQLAMRTLAASASAAYQGLANSLYAETCRRLAKLDETTEHDLTENFPLEHIQAWLLLAYYEFMRRPHRRAMMTAGRAFRMIQVSLLHEIHEPDISLGDFSIGSTHCWVEVEEKRRTFWAAYCLDRCAGLYDGSPLTFHEDGMRTRLPAPEDHFESGQPICMDFLHDAIAIGDRSTLSPFAECVILLTLGGRCIMHRPRIRAAETLYGNDSLEFWARYEWLDTTLDKRRRRLGQILPATATSTDPMLIFTHMIAATIVIHLMETLSSRSFSTAQHRMAMDAYKDRAIQAAREIVLLAKSVTQISCFQAHPFVPGALFHATRILSAARFGNSASTDAAGATQLLEILKRYASLNNLAQDSLRKLEPHGISNLRSNLKVAAPHVTK